nr:dUTP diphosphatase [uncultured bacterium]
MKLKIKKLHPDATIPCFAHANDAGMDLFTVESCELKPGERRSIPIGLAFEIPKGYAGLIWDKSGLSHKNGLKTFGGVIDAGYRGEVCVGIMNLSDRSFVFEKHHKIAQILIQKIEQLTVEEVEILADTARGTKGFGSTGK